jgi:dienelactone hydrolase
MSDVQSETVTYSAGGTTLRGHLARPAATAAKRAGVLVVHEWWGLNDYIRRRADMLAELGYTALAIDMYGDGQTAADPGSAGTLMNAALADRPALEARFRAGYDRLQQEDGVAAGKIAAIGYCFGGAVVLHAARVGMPLAAVVSFHGALGSFHKPAPGEVKAKVLVCHGAADSLVPDADLTAFEREMRDAKADFEVKKLAGALHGFTNPDATPNGKKYGLPLAYDETADRQSWEAMKQLFARTLG